MATFHEGDTVAGKYRVERLLGEGGMGVVFAATHVDLDQKVAIKVLQPEAAAHPEVVARFAREARAAAKIRGPHVARVLDTGRLEDGAPFMVMEYLEGEDLAALVDRRGRLTPREAVAYVLQACEALAEAHAADIVHRDLKPSNLFLAKQPSGRSIVKVLDFGISKVVDEGAALTRTATTMGSPHYMSPEQLTSAKDVDARSDIWSLGVTLFELLTGTRPFEGETMPQIVAQILQNAPPRVCTLAPEVPEGLDLVVLRCMKSSPRQRFDDIAELARALEPFADPSDHVGAAAVSRALTGRSLPPLEERSSRASGAPTMGPRGAAVVPEPPPSQRIPVQGSARPDAMTQAVSAGVLPAPAVDATPSSAREPSRAGERALPRWAGRTVGGAIAVLVLGSAVLFAARSGTSRAGEVGIAERGAENVEPPRSAALPLGVPSDTAPSASAATAPPAQDAGALVVSVAPEAPSRAAPARRSGAQAPSVAPRGSRSSPSPAASSSAAPSTAPASASAPTNANPLKMGIK